VTRHEFSHRGAIQVRDRLDDQASTDKLTKMITDEGSPDG
jgi:hypothetical protein